MRSDYSRLLDAFKKAKGPTKKKKARRRKPRALRVETLELRAMMTAYPFTPGDIVVFQVGNGTAQTTSDATQVFLDEYTANGVTLVQQIPLSTSTAGGNIALTSSGTAGGAGEISLSPNGQELAVFGYNDSTLTAPTADEPESVGVVGANGTIDYEATANNVTVNANTVAISSGNVVYFGGNLGSYFAGTFSNGSTSVTGANVGLGCAADLQIDDGLLFGSSAKSGGIYNFGNTSLPTGAVMPYELPTGASTFVDGSNTVVTVGNNAGGTASYTAGSPADFFLANLGSGHYYDSYDTLYVADRATACGAILKYSYNANGTWTYDGGIEGLTANGSIDAVTGTVSGTTVTLEVTAGGGEASGTLNDGGSIFTVTDNTAIAGNLSSLALANGVQNSNASNIDFRGVAQAPDDGNGTLGSFGGTTDYVRGHTALAIDSAATFADSSNFDGGNLTINGSSTGDTLAVGNLGNITISGNAVSYNGTVIGRITANGANLTIAFNAIVAGESSSNVVTGTEVQGLIAAITFSSTSASIAGNRTITFNVAEHNGNSTSASQTVDVFAGDPPTISQNANLTIDENAGLQTVNLFGITANGAAGQTLSVNATSGTGALIANSSISVNYTNPNASGNITFTPAASIAGTDAVTVTVSDGNGNTSETFDVTIAGPPSITAPNSVAARENESQFVSGIALADSNVGSSNVQLTLAVSHGTLAVSTSVSGGLTSGGVASNGTGSVTLTGSLTAMNNTLTNSAGLTYTPTASYTGSDTLALAASDLGNSGSGAAQTATANVPLTVTDLPPVELNEIEANPPGGDDNRYEYVELSGPAGQSLNDVYFVALDGTANDTGIADLVVNLSNYSLGSDGLLVMQSSANTGHSIPAATTLVSDPGFFTQSGGFVNGSLSFFLFDSPNAAFTAGTDYDSGNGATNSQGTLGHLPSGATVMDSVAILDTNLANTGDVYYGNVLVTEQANQNLGTPDAVTRFPNDNATANAAWYGGELDDTDNVDSTIAYDPTRQGADEPANAYLTPGADNYPEAPVFGNSTYSGTVNTQTAANGTAVVTVSATPESGDALTFALSGTESSAFAISANGAITVANEAAITGTSYALTVKATDGTNGDTANATVNITVESPPIFGDSTYSGTVNTQTAANGTLVATVSATPESGDSVGYSITAGNANSAFAVAVNGAITVANEAAIAGTSYALTIEAADTTNSDTANATVNLSVKSPPVFGKASYTLSAISGNAANGTSVGNITATAETSDTLSYALSGAGSDFFAVSSSGNITIANSPVASGNHTLTLTATDNQNHDSATANVSIDVSQIHIGNQPAFTVNKAAANGAIVGTFVATDTEALTYSLANSAGGAFAINANTGQITVANSSLLPQTFANHATVNDFAVEVMVSDGAGNLTSNITLVESANAAMPPILGAGDANRTISLAENSNAGGNVANVTGDLSVAYTGQKLAYSLAGNDAADFKIGTGGQITAISELAYGVKSSYSLAVEVADSKSSAAVSVIDLTINVTDVVPTTAGANGAQTVNDNKTIDPFSKLKIGDTVANQDLTATIKLSDAGNGNLSLASVPTGANFSVGTGNAVGTYTITGDAAAVTTAIERVVFTPKQNLVAVGLTTDTNFTVKVDDGLGSAGNANNSVTNGSTEVASLSINDAPTITGAVAIQTTLDETAMTPFSRMSIADADVGAGGAISQTEAVTVMLSRAANGNLSLPTSDASLSSAVDFSFANGVASFSGNIAQVTTALDALIFTPTGHQVAPGGTVTTAFAIAVSDGVVTRPTTNNTTTVIATAVNDLPTVAVGNANLAIDDNATIRPFANSSGNASTSDPDFGVNDTLTITLASATLGTLSGGGVRQTGNSTGIYAVTGNMTVLTADLANITFTPKQNLTPPGTVSSEAINFTVEQGNLTTAAAHMTLAITSINDAPTVSGTSNTAVHINDNATIKPYSSNVKIGDVDVGQTETVTVTLSNADHGTLSLANVPAGTTFSADTGNAIGSYAITGNAAAATTALQELVFTPTVHQVLPSALVTTTITIAVIDSGNLNGSDKLSATPDDKTTIVAKAVDDGPTGLNAAIVPGVHATVASSSPIVNLTAVDADFGETFTYSITGGTNRALFQIGGTNNSQLVAKSDLAAGTYFVDVTVADAAGKKFTRDLTLIIGATSSSVS